MPTPRSDARPEETRATNDAGRRSLEPLRTDIPARLDRLPWSRFHWLIGILIGTGSRASVFLGYALGAALMLLAAIVAALLAVNAERTSLERVARPLAAEDPQRG
jgi:hypothetical protein